MYTFIKDYHHGWLKVSIEEIKELNIENKISRYSYIHNGYVYLEEDCDLFIFLSAKCVGYDFMNNVLLENVAGDSVVRSYQKYDSNLIHYARL